MKSRRRHAAVDEVVDPSPFDYTLLSHLYVHADGTDVIDFGGFAPGRENRGRVSSFLKNQSFAPNAAHAVAPEAKGSYLHIRVDDRDAPGDDAPSYPSHRSSSSYAGHEEASNLVRIEDTAEHLWLMCQTGEDAAPFARQFRNVTDLRRYLLSHHMMLPTGEWASEEKGKKARRTTANESSSTSSSSSDTDSDSTVVASLPLAKWLDVQIDPSLPDSAERLSSLLNLLPISQDIKDNCLYLSQVDSIEVHTPATGAVADNMAGYVFLNLMSTPVLATLNGGVGEDEKVGVPAEGAKAKGAAFLRHLTGASMRPKKASTTAGAAALAPTSRGMFTATRSVMEMSFEAVRIGAPRSSVPDPVPVAVLVFADWMFTIHEKPFAEMDDLLRMVQLHCAPSELMAGQPRSSALFTPSMHRRFTTPFVLSVLLQIAVGHHLDSITLAKVVDELGDEVFEIKESQKAQDEVVKRITAVRRCFGECGADTARREVLFATLLQPMLSEQFFIVDPEVRRDLANAQAHLWQFQREISDCRDTVAVSTWYHNVAIQWILIRGGNRALRTVLLLTEMANIMYPIFMLQTLYAMNVRLPFEADGDSPSTTLVPFFVLAAVFLVYLTLTFRAVQTLMHRKSFETQLLA